MPAKKRRIKPKVGCEFVKRFKGKTYKLKIVKSDGEIAYEVGNTAFPSPSGAARSITKGQVNGWKFWRID
jgi:hypothetical protein